MIPAKAVLYEANGRTWVSTNPKPNTFQREAIQIEFSDHSGSVLKRGIEVLTGPVQHLQSISRVEAARIEEQLAEALRDAGLFVKGGH